MPAETDLRNLLKTLDPVLHSGEYVYCLVPNLDKVKPSDAVLTFREEEGYTVVIKKEYADALHLSYSYVAAWITLTVYSSLEAVGLTAAVSEKLTENGISCNIVAGYNHDHIFVSMKDADRAMDALRELARQ